MLTTLARWSVRHRRLVLATWFTLLVGLVALNSVAGAPLNAQAKIPGADSQAAADLLMSRFPARSGGVSDVVIGAPAGIDDPSVRTSVGQLLTRLANIPHVANIVSPYSPAGTTQISPDRKVAFAEVRIDDDDNLSNSMITDFEQATSAARRPGLQVELTGGWFDNSSVPSTETIGLVAAAVILLVAFGSLLAMGLPILVALFGIGTALAAIGLLANIVPMPSFSAQIALMLGLGVGIDYALFIITRYRENLRDGLEPEPAAVAAVAVAGRAVLFAGSTVVISLAGMVLMGMRFLDGLALATSTGVAVAMAASVTLLPALLGFAGRTIDRLALPSARRVGRDSGPGFWHRWSLLVQRYPWPIAVAGLAILLSLAAPLASIHLGAADAGNGPTSSTTRRAYDLLSTGFGPGFNGPLLVAIEVPPGAAGAVTRSTAGSIAGSIAGVQHALTVTPGVAKVGPAQMAPAGDAAAIEVFPTTGPQDQRTNQLVNRLRHSTLPAAVAGTGLQAHVGGDTPAQQDLATRLGGRLPLFIGAVLVLSFLLLIGVFRSVVVPLKAVVVNLLSIGAAYGILVAVFQWGWGKGLLGLRPGPVESYVPMMLFAILFGLSMDYEVFLLSRVKEEYDRTGDNRQAVAEGLAGTARVITAAAAIMVMVFGGFIFSDARVLKEFGIGLSFAVLIDATIVRLLLVPATMELLGDANWWLPGRGRRNGRRVGAPVLVEPAIGPVVEPAAEPADRRIGSRA
jgi:RND superfamily putative drug exporter